MTETDKSILARDDKHVTDKTIIDRDDSHYDDEDVLNLPYDEWRKSKK